MTFKSWSSECITSLERQHRLSQWIPISCNRLSVIQLSITLYKSSWARKLLLRYILYIHTIYGFTFHGPDCQMSGHHVFHVKNQLIGLQCPKLTIQGLRSLNSYIWACLADDLWNQVMGEKNEKIKSPVDFLWDAKGPTLSHARASKSCWEGLSPMLAVSAGLCMASSGIRTKNSLRILKIGGAPDPTSSSSTMKCVQSTH